MDNHHIAGTANSPITISIPANDHRSQLSADQHDWPKETLENRSGSPLLRAAACIRGFHDTMLYLADRFLDWIADLLETLDSYLQERLGLGWWRNTPVADAVPEGRSNVEA
jgi:hypothetical protein